MESHEGIRVEDLAALVKEERKKNRLSRRKLAEEVGINDETIRRFEDGETQMGLGSLIKVLRVFGLEILIVRRVGK
jgi:ribosome-binding protein aMBF1 (putative translation factor)